jgi:hypothetical protein
MAPAHGAGSELWQWALSSAHVSLGHLAIGEPRARVVDQHVELVVVRGELPGRRADQGQAVADLPNWSFENRGGFGWSLRSDW